jgi:hypothetical protein
VSIGFWKIPRSRNTEANDLAKEAARSKFTPAELADIAQNLRAEKQLTEAKANSSKPKDFTALEPKTAATKLEDQVPAQDAERKGKIGNIIAVGTGPVSCRLFWPETSVLIAQEDLAELMAKHLHTIG